MNIEIHLRKQDNQSNPDLTVSFGDIIQHVTVKDLKQTILINRIKHESDTKLIIERNDTKLYNTKHDHHSNKIFVDRVIVDNFWQFDKDFYPPTTQFHNEYKEHIKKVGSADWIANSMKFNTHLYFNGCLEWNVKYPVRRCFFKDIER